ncbi:MAG: hypothetical protein ACLVJ6_09590 [Merdibacter sp.]
MYFQGEEIGKVPLVASKTIERSQALYYIEQIKSFFNTFIFKFVLTLVIILIVLYAALMIVRNHNRRRYQNRRRRPPQRPRPRVTMHKKPAPLERAFCAEIRPLSRTDKTEQKCYLSQMKEDLT